MRLASVLGAAALLWAGALEAQTSLTVYQDGRVMVRRTLNVPVPRGVSTLPVDLGGRSADPSTIVALDDGVEISGARVSAGTGASAALRRAVGQEIEWMTIRGDSGMRFVRGTLLSADPVAVRIDGRIVFSPPGIPAFPESLVSLAPRADITVDAARPQERLRLAWQLQGLR